MTKKEIGKVLRQLRLNCGKTQREVAAEICRPQQVIGHWETGYSQPDANTLFTLCSIYGVSVDEAFGFKNNEREVSLLNDYRSLNSDGKKEAEKRINELTYISKYTEK